MNNLIKALQELKETTNKTVQKIADEIGISPPHYYHISKGTRTPSLKFYEKIVKYLKQNGIEFDSDMYMSYLMQNMITMPKELNKSSKPLDKNSAIYKITNSPEWTLLTKQYTKNNIERLKQIHGAIITDIVSKLQFGMKELAFKIGCTPSVVQKWARGETLPRVSNYIELTNKFGYDKIIRETIGEGDITKQLGQGDYGK